MPKNVGARHHWHTRWRRPWVLTSMLWRHNHRKFSDGSRNNYMHAIAGPESAFDLPLFPSDASHLCCHERSGWGRQNWLCPRAPETLGTPLIKRTVTWLFPDRAIKGKPQKRLEKHIRTFYWSSGTNFKTVLFQLAWFSCLFDASLVSRFVSWCGNRGCALMQPHTCACNMGIISSFVINWQFRRVDHNGSHNPVSVLSPQ